YRPSSQGRALTLTVTSATAGSAAARSIIGGLHLTDTIRCGEPLEHNRLSSHINHVVVPLVRNEMPRHSPHAFVDAGRVASSDALQLVDGPVAQGANELHIARLVGSCLGDPPLAVGNGLRSAVNLFLHLLGCQHDELGVLS